MRSRSRAGTRWSHVIQRHPWPAAILGLVFLLVLAIPLLSMRLGFTDAGNRPESDTTRQAYDLAVADGFGARASTARCCSPAETPDGRGQADVGALTTLSTKLNRDQRRRARHTPPQSSPEGTVAVMQVFPTTDPQAKATADLFVTHLRDDVIPATTVGNERRRRGRWAPSTASPTTSLRTRPSGCPSSWAQC